VSPPPLKERISNPIYSVRAVNYTILFIRRNMHVCNIDVVPNAGFTERCFAAYKSRVNELAVSDQFIRQVYPLPRKTREAYYWLILLRSLFMAGEGRAPRRCNTCGMRISSCDSPCIILARYYSSAVDYGYRDRTEYLIRILRLSRKSVIKFSTMQAESQRNRRLCAFRAFVPHRHAADSVSGYIDPRRR